MPSRNFRWSLPARIEPPRLVHSSPRRSETTCEERYDGRAESAENTRHGKDRIETRSEGGDEEQGASDRRPKNPAWSSYRRRPSSPILNLRDRMRLRRRSDGSEGFTTLGAVSGSMGSIVVDEVDFRGSTDNRRDLSQSMLSRQPHSDDDCASLDSDDGLDDANAVGGHSGGSSSSNGTSTGTTRRGKMARGLSKMAKKLAHRSTRSAEALTLPPKRAISSGVYERGAGRFQKGHETTGGKGLRSGRLNSPRSSLPDEWRNQTPSPTASVTPRETSNEMPPSVSTPEEDDMPSLCTPSSVRDVLEMSSTSTHDHNAEAREPKSSWRMNIRAVSEETRRRSVSPSRKWGKGARGTSIYRTVSRSLSPPRSGRKTSPERLRQGNRDGPASHGKEGAQESAYAQDALGSPRAEDMTKVVHDADPRKNEPLPAAGDFNAEAIPLSTLKYGDKLRLWARRPVTTPHQRRHTSMPSNLDLGSGNSEAGGYVGSLDKVQRVHQRLFRRSEVAVIGDETLGGFINCDFAVVDPGNKHKVGEPVCFGHSVQLVDGRDFVWNDKKGSGLTGALKLKPRGSKNAMYVAFKQPDRETKLEQEDPVPFNQGLSIVSAGFDAKDNRRRRNASGSGSRKNQVLTAYSKKATGSSKLAGSFVRWDGRGEEVLFEAHLPDGSTEGDKRPFVTKVIFHTRDQSGQVSSPTRSSMSFVSPVQSPAVGNDWAAATQMKAAAGAAVLDCSEELRPYSTGHIEPLATSPILGIVSEDQLGKVTVGEQALSTMSLTSPTHSAERAQETEDDYEDLMSFDGGLGDHEGLMWGKFVQFKVPPENEMEPSETVLTVRLSNECSASLTSQQLREYAGQGECRVEAYRTPSKGSLETESGSSGGGGDDVQGAVYLQCVLEPLVGLEAEKTMASVVVGAKTGGSEVKRGTLLSSACSCLGFFGTLLTNLTGEEFSGKARVVMKHKGRGRVSSRLRLPIRIFYGSVFVASSLCLSMTYGKAPLLSSGGIAEVAPPAPCTIWDLRRADGTSYPGDQLSAAAAALGLTQADVEQQQQQQKGRDQASSGGSGRDFGPYQEASKAKAAGNGASSARASGTRAAGTRRRSRPPYSSSVGRSVWEEGFAKARGNFVDRGRIDESRRMCALLVALGAALSAAVMVMATRLSGDEDDGDEAALNAKMAIPMQARVQLLRWDGRSASEVAAAQEAANSVDGIYYPPPRDSKLAPMPHRFALAENMDMDKAWNRWEATLTWRRDNKVDDILSKPHPRFLRIKSLYPHCFHLPDKGGRLTYFERPGQAKFADLNNVGITKQELLDHYVFCMEFLWQVLQPKQSQRITIIIDLAGVRLRDAVGESVSFLKTTVGVMAKHYPQRSFKILILNAPSFFNVVFAAVKPMLNEATKKKIDLLPVAHAGVELLKIIPPENLPPHYGGTCKDPLMESPAEKKLLAHVQRVLDEHGQTMET